MQFSCNIILTHEIAEKLAEEPFFAKDGTVLAYQVSDDEKSPTELNFNPSITLWNFNRDPTDCDASGWGLVQIQIYLFLTSMFHWRNIEEITFSFWDMLPLYHDIIENIEKRIGENLATSSFLHVSNILTLLGTRIGLYKPSEIISQAGNMELVKQAISKLRHITHMIVKEKDCYSRVVKAMVHNLEHEFYNINYFQSQKECSGDEVSLLEVSREGDDALDGIKDPFSTDVYTECRFSKRNFCVMAQKFQYVPNIDLYRFISEKLPRELKFQVDSSYPSLQSGSLLLGQQPDDITTYKILERISSIKDGQIPINDFLTSSRAFKKRFWFRRRENGGNFFRFGVEEIKYTYNSLVKIMETCGKLNQLNAIEPAINGLSGLDTILNSLRLNEITSAITINNCGYFSKITLQILSSMNRTNSVPKDLPNALILINAKITYWVGREHIGYRTLIKKPKTKPFNIASNESESSVTSELFGTSASVLTLTASNSLEDL